MLLWAPQQKITQKSLDAARSHNLDPSKNKITPSHVDAMKKTSYPEIKQNRVNHHMILGVDSLEEDSKEVSKFLSGFQKIFNYLKQVYQESAVKIPEDTMDQFLRIEEILERAKHHIVVYKQMKQIEISDVEIYKNLERLSIAVSKKPKGSKITSGGFPQKFPNVPSTQVTTSNNNSLKKVGDSIVKELVELIKNDKLLRPIQAVHELSTRKELEHPLFLQRAGLKTIGLLLKNDLANVESIRRTYHDLELVQKVIEYSYRSFRIGLGDLVSFVESGSPYVTENWYWSFLHIDSLQVLSTKEEQIINTTILIARLRNAFENGPIFMDQYTQWRSLKNSNTIERFKSRLGVIDDSKGKGNIIQNINDPKEFDKDVKKIIDIFLIFGDTTKYEDFEEQEEMHYLLFNLLEVIDRYFSPGSIKNVTLKHARSQRFQDQFQLMKLITKMCDLNQQANSYYGLYQKLTSQKKYSHDTITSNFFNKSTFDGYIDELEMVIVPELMRKLELARDENDHVWFQYGLDAYHFEKNRQKRLNEFKEKSKHFLVL